MKSVFIESFDVLALRGNKLFGDPGSIGESLIPPWPSVAAGAIRSMMLARDGDDAAFAQGRLKHPTLGTPSEPGPFTVTAFHIAQVRNDRIEPAFTPPADLVIGGDDSGLTGRYLRPASPAGEIACSSPLPLLPILGEEKRMKPFGGLWLTAEGWRAYSAAAPILENHLVASSELWQQELRVGVGLSPERRHAEEGKLFSAYTVAFKRDVGFLASIAGADLAGEDLLRFGGDGHSVRMRVVNADWPEPDFDTIVRNRRARLVLTTPGLFENGWLPTGVFRSTDAAYRLDLHGVRARLVCAAIPRAQVVSGFDLANWRPKLALRAAATGSVYWLDDIEATTDALRKLVAIGLWPGENYNDPRRAEGFNRISLAQYLVKENQHVQ